MARKRGTSGKAAGKIVTVGPTKARTLSAGVVGRPGYVETGQQQRRGSIAPFKARTVPTLIKKDIAKGITQPEAKIANEAVGQITPATRSRTMHESPQVPVKTGTNKRVIAAPSPTSGAGVRSPFNQKTRVGKRGNSKRFNKN